LWLKKSVRTQCQNLYCDITDRLPEAVGKRMKKPTYWTCAVCGAPLDEEEVNPDLKDDPSVRAKIGEKCEGFLCGACGFKLLRAHITPRLAPDELESFDASAKQEEKKIQKRKRTQRIGKKLKIVFRKREAYTIYFIPYFYSETGILFEYNKPKSTDKSQGVCVNPMEFKTDLNEAVDERRRKPRFPSDPNHETC